MKQTHESDHHHHAMSEATPTVRDPVCGMQVDPGKTEHHTVHEGVTYAFCSSGCRERFIREPDTYLQPKPVPQAVEGSIYTCPMHPDVEHDGTGSCPICGMALEPKIVMAPPTKTQYTCPMHPEVVQNEPGSCPKCGMALEPIVVTEVEEEDPELRDMTRRFWISALLTVPVSRSQWRKRQATR